MMMLASWAILLIYIQRGENADGVVMLLEQYILSFRGGTQSEEKKYMLSATKTEGLNNEMCQ